jgi:hypothetical protein
MKGLLPWALWVGLGVAVVDAVDAAPPEAESAPQAGAADRPVTPEQLAFFESKIRPVLVTSCYKCHSASAEKIRGGLLLDTREGIRKGGDSGAAVVPGNLEESVLVQAIRFQDDDLQMPPKQKLPDEVIADFERWVAMGAPDPRDGTVTATAKGIDIEEGRRFWAFQPPRKVAPPKIEDEAWPRSESDRYLLAALEAKGLKPVGDADKYTLLRRACFDLIGLPPSPEEVDSFVKDESPTAFETVVDRLLAAPQFGERWGRHWLDVSRFAESSGKQVNFNYPHAWRYRDYVIAAFNTDKPYSRFIKEQIAGDLLPAADEAKRAEQTIATGFLAVGPKSHVEPNPLQFQMDVADEQIDATSQAFLGLTVACARCHDHKFDPIPTRDYYAMAGIFRSTETCYGTTRIVQNFHPAPLLTLVDPAQPSGIEPVSSQQLEQMRGQAAELVKTRAQLQKEGKLSTAGQGIALGIRLAALQSRVALYEADGTPKRLAMGVRERVRVQNSPIYPRGEIDKPGELVPRGVVQVLTTSIPEIRQGSGRLELADWLASLENPLTARVMVNRIWLHLFGRGLVPTPDNFGAAGQPPSHPELLDHLAVTFMENGWSVKTLIRQLVLSRAYQLDSRFDARANEADPDNVLVWRMSKRRLEAEAVRDAMLAVSGQLDRAKPKGSAVSRAGDANSGGLQRAGAFDARLTVRSVYLPVLRNNFLDSLALFDFPDAGLIVAERATTTVPAQALYLLNSPFVMHQAELAATRLLSESDADCDCERIRTAYLRVFNRLPTEEEQTAIEEFLGIYGDGQATPNARPAGPTDPGAVWAAIYQALFASAEFLYRG